MGTNTYKMTSEVSSIAQIIIYFYLLRSVGHSPRIQKLVLSLKPYSRRHFAFDTTLVLKKDIYKRLPKDKSTKLQYNLLAFITSFLRVTDEDSLSDIAQYGHPLRVFSLL